VLGALTHPQEDGLAERKGVEMRILGALDLAPPSVRGAAARLMRATAGLKDKRAVLNICFSYTWV
jgi:undecaprenyl pyrophosphate synthase